MATRGTLALAGHIKGFRPIPTIGHEFLPADEWVCLANARSGCTYEAHTGMTRLSFLQL